MAYSSCWSSSSAAVVVLLLLIATDGIGVGRSSVDAVFISVENGEGRILPWGPIESCPEGSRAIGYDTRNDQTNLPNVGPLFDDTALNTVRLYCDDPLGTNITSAAGEIGLWGIRLDCPGPGTFLTAFELRVQPAGI